MHLVALLPLALQLVPTVAIALPSLSYAANSPIVPHQLEQGDGSRTSKISSESPIHPSISRHRLDSRDINTMETSTQHHYLDSNTAENDDKDLELRDSAPLDYKDWVSGFPDYDSLHPPDWENQVLERRDSADWAAEFPGFDTVDYEDQDGHDLKRRDFTPVDLEEREAEAADGKAKTSEPSIMDISYYPVDDPGRPLLQKPDQLISPAKDLPREYFNVSNFRTWRPSHDKARPKERFDWRQPRRQAYCILSGVGKRPVYWQPKLVQDFFYQPHQHSHREQGPMFPQHNHAARGHDFQYFWNTDVHTNLTKAYSMFLTSSPARWNEISRWQNDAMMPRYKLKKSKYRLEHCRQACETCFDAARETGAEQFICSREEGGKHHGKGGFCRAAMILGDAIGRSETCQTTGTYNRLCADKLPEVYAQDGAVPNLHPSLICDSIRPCTTDACQVSNDTRLLAQAASCKLLARLDSSAMDAVGKPRWPLLGYTSLSQAMNDSSLFVYYQDFSTDATAEEKAFVLDSPSRFALGIPPEEYGPWWTGYSVGEPTPFGWNGTNVFGTKDPTFKGKVGFGSAPGGFVLQHTPWSKHLVETLGTIDMWHREHYEGQPNEWLAHPDDRDVDF
ncbi:MAG: hypothetical protein GOMPHAMPRED_004339 [Gomphillus americanus]|uniref:Uncharacterized protein n=1 Tax=Gomphillus americanus TaxID=1940652 RepID=A0A8H3FM78_9LECA|nr:MAG: hypothetical protein GOMPHAMPRED_004339 [Gomphillus americanus]